MKCAKSRQLSGRRIERRKEQLVEHNRGGCSVCQKIEGFDRPTEHGRKGGFEHRAAEGFGLGRREGLRGPFRALAGRFNHPRPRRHRVARAHPVATR